MISKKEETWLSDVIKALRNLGGQAHYSEIYKTTERIRAQKGATWPPSAEAIIRRVLEEQSSDTQSFKGKDYFYSVDGLGKGVWGLRNISHDFQIGELYNRQHDIHGRFGGIRQTGISPSQKAPYIFVFTGVVGEQFGYKDGWDSNGIFHYAGEGQKGDMAFTNGNKSLQEHAKDGRDILMFQHRGKGKPYRFMGQFVCVGYELKELPDINGDLRNGIIFQLKNVDEEIDITPPRKEAVLKNLSLQELRNRAYSAVNNVKMTSSNEGKRVYYERNNNIKAYVLARSGGKCECCGTQAPFLKKDGSPYLEPHHIRKLSDKGLDHPKMIAALTPNCHREIHHGVNGQAIDDRLLIDIAKKETEIETNEANKV